MLEYRRICSLGAQVQRLFRTVPPEQRLVLVFDDIVARPRECYQRMVEFLGVTDDGREAFLRENDFARPRSWIVARFSRSIQTHPVLKWLRVRVKPFLNRHDIYLVERALQKNWTPVKRSAIAPGLKRQLCEEFRADVTLLGRLLERDLSHWLS